MDFLVMREISRTKNGKYIKLEPTFNLGDSEDIIIKGGKIYAIFDENKKVWVTDKDNYIQVLDNELKKIYKEYEKDLEKRADGDMRSYLENDFRFDKFGNSSSGYLKRLNTFAKEIDSVNGNVDLNTKVIFKNMELTKEDYSTGKMNYAIEEGSTECWDNMIDVLYAPDEKEKIEWLIGSVISGYSQVMQKFFVFYGPPKSGKSTVLNIIQEMFKGYFAPFNAKRLVSTSEFALDSLANNPLLAIEHDGDLSKIIDNSLLNSVVSHETMMMNVKFKTPYVMKFRSLLLLGTNTPVKITDSKSGIKRRLIDIQPSGNKIPVDTFDTLYKRIIKYEKGAIAYKCLQVFNTLGKNYYNKYEPVSMSYKTDSFYNFVDNSYEVFERQDYTYLDQAWKMYKVYSEDSGDKIIYNKTQVRENLKDFFDEYCLESQIEENGKVIRHVYFGFKKEMFNTIRLGTKKKREAKKDVTIAADKLNDVVDWLSFNNNYGEINSQLDIYLKDCKAQYATKDGIPSKRWENVETTLKDISTDKLHYVLAPETLIVLDFDKKNDKGEKDFKLNYDLAKEFPRTYAELSKSGAGIHLHYLYSGDVSELSRILSDDVEIKIFTGNASLRRQLTKFNNEPIAKISGGLPLKEKKGGKMLDLKAMQNENVMRRTIIRCLRNEIHGHHKPNIEFIYKILNDAYENGVHYDLSDMYQDVLNYAMASSNKAEYCLDLVAKMPFKSEESSAPVEYTENLETPIVFDVEVWPNLYIFGFKFVGGEKHILVNPKPEDIEPLLKYKLIGFNCRRYDNHIVYAHLNGYNNEQLFNLSQRIINAEKGAKDVFFGEAYNLSYTDIYDYSKTKQSLKKWELELGIYHKEMETDWNKPLPEELWDAAVEYNGYDLDATEAVWMKTQKDFVSREILADLSGGCVNDTDNMLTARLIFGNERHPQTYFNYRNLAEPVYEMDDDERDFLTKIFPEMMSQPHGDKKSLLPYFEGYVYDPTAPKDQKSIYKGEPVGEGGLVRAVPGAYGHTITFDVTSMHPHSFAAEYLFGHFTRIAYSLVQARVAIKHDNMEFLGKIFDGRLLKYLGDKDTKKRLSTSLKTPINAIYGQTAAKFENKFKDPRNIDNIVAKRGALFMMDLKEAVTNLGYQIIHVKTDSLKVVNPDEFIYKFIMDFGKRYGYSFEVEHEFEKICLVNDAVYIAKLSTNDKEWLDECKEAAEKGEPEPTRWTATGAQFQNPYVFKTVFSKQPITFDDLTCTINVTKGALYLDYNENLPNVTTYELFKDIYEDTLAGNKMDKYTKRSIAMAEEFFRNNDISELYRLIAEGHKRNFIGKVGKFCPIQEGYGGAELLCFDKGKYSSPSGTKGVRWLEAEYVKNNHLEDKIDYGYFDSLANEAINDVSQYDPNFIE